MCQAHLVSVQHSQIKDPVLIGYSPIPCSAQMGPALTKTFYLPEEQKKLLTFCKKFYAVKYSVFSNVTLMSCWNNSAFQSNSCHFVHVISFLLFIFDIACILCVMFVYFINSCVKNMTWKKDTQWHEALNLTQVPVKSLKKDTCLVLGSHKANPHSLNKTQLVGPFGDHWYVIYTVHCIPPKAFFGGHPSV